jgi:hypothetical protein
MAQLPKPLALFLYVVFVAILLQMAMDSALVWVASYEHSWRQLSHHNESKRTRCLLDPSLSWLNDRLKGLHPPRDFDLTLVSNKCQCPLHLAGLIEVCPGHLRDIISPRTPEADVQWHYFKQPVDSFTVQVRNWYKCSDEVPLYFRKAAKQSNDHRTISLGESGLIYPCNDLQDMMLLDKQGGIHVARNLHAAINDVPMLTLVAPISVLLFENQWRHLLFLARWKIQLWPAWPPQAWREEVAKANWPDNKTLEADSLTNCWRTFKGLAADLRGWAPRILNSGPLEFTSKRNQVGKRVATLWMSCLCVALSIPFLQFSFSFSSCLAGDPYGDHSGEEQLSLERYLRTLDAVVNSNRYTADHGKNNRYSPEMLIRTVFAASKLRNKGNWKQLLQTQVVPMLPLGARALAEAALHNNTWRIPHWSSRLQLSLDASVMMHRRNNYISRVHYLLADSSPQGDRDWLIVCDKSIDQGMLTSVMRAVCDLTIDAQTRLAAAPQDEETQGFGHEDEMPARGIDRSSAFALLAQAVQCRTQVPVGLGYKKVNVEDKAAALLHSTILETGLEHLGAHLASVVSITTDFGVESGLNDFSIVQISKLLPYWITSGAMESDTGDTSRHDNVHLLSLEFMFMNSLPVSGLLHIFSNASKDVDKALVSWDSFYSSLKVLEKFICHPQYVLKFIATCLECTYLSPLAKLFKKKVHHLYDKRWHEVFHFCAQVRPLLGPLAAAWDSRKFLGVAADADASGDAAFNTASLQQVLRDDWFHAYMDMLMHLDEVLQSMYAWAEQCPCHRHLQQQYRQHVPISVSRREFGAFAETHPQLSCPLRGCNAPELAAGVLPEMLDKSFAAGVAALAAAWLSRLSNRQWSDLVGEMDRGKAQTLYIVTLKTQHWQELPWLLCGLAHTDETVARTIAVNILQKYDSWPTAAVHHRLTLKFCSANADNKLQAQLRSFSEGASLQDLPDLLQEVSALRCIPVTERHVEAKHSLVLKALTHRHHGPLSVSMAVRLREIEKEFSSEKDFAELAACMAQLNRVRHIPEAFMMTHHPWIRSMPKEASSNAWVSLLSLIIYRCDLVSQYASFHGSRVANEKAKQLQLKRARAELPAKAYKVWTQEAFMLTLATDHFREHVHHNEICSLPFYRSDQSSRPVFLNLQHALQGPSYNSAHCLTKAGSGGADNMQVDFHEDSNIQAEPEALGIWVDCGVCFLIFNACSDNITNTMCCCKPDLAA